MNCVNHPEAAVSAYCQNCGKGLCSACARTVQGSVFCEPCLAARMPGAPPIPGVPGMPPPPGGPNPGLATLLGFIPGVGAMYNGQYIKAIVHVIVFVVLVGLSSRYGVFGLFVAFWVLYQVFDAHQTAKARRDGLPLPDPFGLNDLGNTLGGQRPVPPPPPGASSTGPGGTAPPPPYPDWGEHLRGQAEVFGRQAEVFGQQVEQHARIIGQQAGQWGEQLRQRIVAEANRPFAPGFTGTPPASGPGYGPAAPGYPPPPGYASGYAPPPPPPGYVPPAPPPVPPEMELERARREPIGAIVLILLGMLFLFNTMGFFSFHWLGHGWPWIILAIAVWLLVRSGGGRFRMGMHMPTPPVVEPPEKPGDTQPPPGGER